MTHDALPPDRRPFDPNRIRAAAGDEPLADRRTGGVPEPVGTAPARLSRDAPPIMTVSQLTRMVKSAIQRALPSSVHVVGELSNVARPAGGHLYFTLKDVTSEVRCVMWRSSARSLRFDLTDGLEVVATGAVDVYEPRGQYQLYVRRMEPRGVGALELAFAQLKERLGRDGLFDPARKRPLPRFPKRIAVVTSESGAAISDILQTLRRRYPKVLVFVFGVRVQGDGAADEIADAIARINRSSDRLGGIDVMIVGRGGGSLEDLWAFNEEPVARAIFASDIPVVSAVGHEMDFTIADFVADVRAATPTAAAELVVPVLGEVRAGCDELRHRLSRGIRRHVESVRNRLALTSRSAWFADPLGQLRRRGQIMDELAARLRLAVARCLARDRAWVHDVETQLVRVRPAVVVARRRESLARCEHRLHRVQARFSLFCERRLGWIESRLRAASPRARIEKEKVFLEALTDRSRLAIRGMNKACRRSLNSLGIRLAASSHHQVLKRGFTLTRSARDKRLIKKASDVREGDRLLTETGDGEIASRVIDQRQGVLFD